MPKQTGKGNFKSIYCKLFDSPEFQELPWDAKGLFLVLRGQQDTNMAGVFRYYMGPIRRRTSGLSEEARVAAFHELFNREFVLFDKHTMWIVGALGNDPFITLTNPKHKTGVMNLLRALPPTLLLDRFLRKYREIRPDPDLTVRMEEALEAAPPLGELGGEDEPAVVPTFTPSSGWILAHELAIGLLRNEPRRNVPSNLAEWSRHFEDILARGWTEADVRRGVKFALNDDSFWKAVILDAQTLAGNWDKIVESAKIGATSTAMAAAKGEDQAQERRRQDGLNERANREAAELRRQVNLRDSEAGRREPPPGTGLTALEKILRSAEQKKEGRGSE